MSMFVSIETTHVFRGKGRSHRCELCGMQLHVGQIYRRWVWRQGSSPLFVSVEHNDGRDCPYEQEEEMLAESAVAVAVPIATVISSRVVAKIGINGETVYVTEPYTEMKVGGPDTDPAPNEPGPNIPDTEDEIPF